MAYIDVDKFAEKICNFQAIDEDCANKMIWLLRTFPTAEVQEVKHGEWENFEIPHMMRCSECGISDLDIHRTKFYYCPYCGAKMDGGNAE